MPSFHNFHKHFARPQKQVRPPREFLDSPEGHADEQLRTLWQEDGWASYGDGLFWTVDPREFEDLREDWPIVPPGAMVFARSAFADLYMTKDGDVFTLDVRMGLLLPLGPQVEVFFESTLEAPSLTSPLLDRELFEKVRKRVGDLSRDECYGVFPAVPLGGDDEDPEAYHRVKLREYLAISAQAHAG